MRLRVALVRRCGSFGAQREGGGGGLAYDAAQGKDVHRGAQPGTVHAPRWRRGRRAPAPAPAPTPALTPVAMEAPQQLLFRHPFEARRAAHARQGGQLACGGGRLT